MYCIIRGICGDKNLQFYHSIFPTQSVGVVNEKNKKKLVSQTFVPKTVCTKCCLISTRNQKNKTFQDSNTHMILSIGKTCNALWLQTESNNPQEMSTNCLKQTFWSCLSFILRHVKVIFISHTFPFNNILHPLSLLIRLKAIIVSICQTQGSYWHIILIETQKP